MGKQAWLGRILADEVVIRTTKKAVDTVSCPQRSVPDRVRQAGGEQDEELLANTPAGVDELAAPGSRRKDGQRGHNKDTTLQSTGADVLIWFDAFGPTASVH